MAVFNVCWCCLLILGIVFCLSPSESVDPLSRCSPLLPRTKYLKAADWGKCYEFHMEERTWRSANSICSSKGGHLVTIKEERIQKFLISSLYELSWPRNGLWIGATDKEKEMEWVWVTGERVDRGYSRWAAGQPSCGFLCFEDCAVMRWKDGGRWHDYRCNWLEDYSFICEYDMLPEPTTTTVLTTTTTTTTTTSPLPETATSPVLQTNATSIILSPSSKNLESEYLLHGGNGENGAEEGDENDTSAGQPPAVMLDGASGARAEQVQEKLSSSQSGLGSGSVAFIVIAILVSLVAGLCFTLVVIRRRHRKLNGEDDKGISYENPYYESSAPDSGSGESHSDDADILEETDDEGAVACCNGGGAAVGFTASTPLKKHTEMKQPPPPHHTRPRLVMNDYDTPPTLRINHTKTLERGRNHHENMLNTTKEDNRSHAALMAKDDSVFYDELQSCYANSQNGYDVPRASTEPWYRNNDRSDLSPDDDEMYYNTREENIYESVDNLSALEEQQRRTQTDEIDTHALRDDEESRYVPFVLDDPKVDPAY